MKKIFTLLFIFMASILTATGAHADNKITSYSVTPYFSEHQTAGVNNYYDIAGLLTLRKPLILKLPIMLARPRPL